MNDTQKDYLAEIKSIGVLLSSTDSEATINGDTISRIGEIIIQLVLKICSNSLID